MEAQDGATRQEAKRGLVDVLREDMQRVDVTEEDEEDGERWRMMIRCGDSEKKKQKGSLTPKEEEELFDLRLMPPNEFLFCQIYEIGVKNAHTLGHLQALKSVAREGWEGRKHKKDTRVRNELGLWYGGETWKGEQA